MRGTALLTVHPRDLPHELLRALPLLVAMGYVPQIQPPNSTLEHYDANYHSTSQWWQMAVWPKVPGVGGDRSFYIDTRCVIRVELSGVATSLGPPLD